MPSTGSVIRCLFAVVSVFLVVFCRIMDFSEYSGMQQQLWEQQQEQALQGPMHNSARHSLGYA